MDEAASKFGTTHHPEIARRRYRRRGPGESTVDWAAATVNPFDQGSSSSVDAEDMMGFQWFILSCIASCASIPDRPGQLFETRTVPLPISRFVNSETPKLQGVRSGPEPMVANEETVVGGCLRRAPYGRSPGNRRCTARSYRPTRMGDNGFALSSRGGHLE